MASFFGEGGPLDLLRGGLGIPKFEDTFKCYSMVFFSDRKGDAEHGGKIILPPSALEKLATLNITYPMLFRLTNPHKNRHTHCGVLEFCAEEGRVYVPHWMLQQLFAQDGDLIQVSYSSLKLATFSKFQPQTVDFLDITNPKAVLELKLRLFACLSKGDIIKINYNDKDYELLVLETKPDDAVSIIECDMKVDFAAPVGYKEPKVERMETTDGSSDESDERIIDECLAVNKEFQAFQGQGQRLDGKTKSKKSASSPPRKPVRRERGTPNYNYQKGKITFAKAKSLKVSQEEEQMEESESTFTAFSGSGQPLKAPKNKKARPRR